MFNSLLLMLVLAQFFIAILVSAWDGAAPVEETPARLGPRALLSRHLCEPSRGNAQAARPRPEPS